MPKMHGAIFGRDDTTFVLSGAKRSRRIFKTKIPPLRLLPWMACMPKMQEQFLVGMTMVLVGMTPQLSS